MIIVSFLISVTLSGCGTTAIAVATTVYNKEQQKKWQATAFSHTTTEAQYKYGKAHCCGSDIMYDNKEATKWLCKAAKNDHANAQYKIASIYNADKGLSFPTEVLSKEKLPEDNVVSFVWYALSSFNGNDKAESYVQRIAERMDEVERREAYEMLRNYPNIPCEIED